MRTLRARLLAATAAVLAAVLTALALFSARVTRIELHRLENVLVSERHMTQSAEPVRRALEEAYRSAGSWATEMARSAVARAAAAAGREIVVLDEEGRVAARSPGLAGATIARIFGGALQVDSPSRGGARILIRAPSTPVSDAAGRVVGRFYLIPASHAALEPARSFAGSANRWLAGAALAAGLVA
ncbi:MAG TPA: hypothetical protein VE007_08270, partial [Thermoanaerobaculia bacterium]|nr:hypothetical protein [Thermoanaerobaculia bacterium]